MPPPDSALTWRTWFGFAVAAALIAAAATPLALWVGPAHRAIVERAAAALLAAIVLPRLVRAMRGAAGLDADPTAEFLPRDVRPAADPDPGFARLAGELHAALARSNRVGPSLWTRLRAIAARRGIDTPAPAAGDARTALMRLITTIEDAP